MKKRGRIIMLVMMMMLKLHKHSRHYLCLFHQHHPSCFLCDLYQMPDTGWLLISTMWFASYWPLWHNLSVSWHRKWHQWIKDTFFWHLVAAPSWNRWSNYVLNDKRQKRKRKEKWGWNRKRAADGLLLCGFLSGKALSRFSSGRDLAVNTGTGQDEDTDKN